MSSLSSSERKAQLSSFSEAISSAISSRQTAYPALIARLLHCSEYHPCSSVCRSYLRQAHCGYRRYAPAHATGCDRALRGIFQHLCAEGFRPHCSRLHQQRRKHESQSSRPLYIDLSGDPGNTACRTAQRLPASFPSESSAAQGCPR